MSLSQRSLGCSDVKSRWMRLSDALVWRESVLTRKRRIALGRISALRFSLATVFRQHGTFCASSSTWTLGAPHDSRLPWWIVLIRAVRSPWRCRRALGTSKKRGKRIDRRGGSDEVCSQVEMLVDAILSELGVTAHVLYMVGTFALVMLLTELILPLRYCR